MRLFIAVNFDDTTKEKIAAVQARLRAAATNGVFSHPENLHLTLAFLGEMEPGRVGLIRQAMERTQVTPLYLTFDRIGFFRRDAGDLWWIGLCENQQLLRMQQELSENLAGAGFQLESRAFKPHITLARQVVLPQPVDLHRPARAPFSTHINQISLMQSERIGGKLTYTELYTREGTPFGSCTGGGKCFGKDSCRSDDKP